MKFQLTNQLPNPSQVELAHHVNDFTDNGVQGNYTLLALQNALSCNSVFDLDANGNPEFPDYRSARAEVKEQIEEEKQPFSYFPNPVENNLQLQLPFEETQEVEIEIYTLDGKLIDRQQKAVK